MYNEYMEMPTFNKNMKADDLSLKIVEDKCCDSCSCKNDGEDKISLDPK